MGLQWHLCETEQVLKSVIQIKTAKTNESPDHIRQFIEDHPNIPKDFYDDCYNRVMKESYPTNKFYFCDLLFLMDA